MPHQTICGNSKVSPCDQQSSHCVTSKLPVVNMKGCYQVCNCLLGNLLHRCSHTVCKSKLWLEVLNCSLCNCCSIFNQGHSNKECIRGRGVPNIVMFCVGNGQNPVAQSFWMKPSIAVKQLVDWLPDIIIISCVSSPCLQGSDWSVLVRAVQSPLPNHSHLSQAQVTTTTGYRNTP